MRSRLSKRLLILNYLLIDELGQTLLEYNMEKNSPL
jgi:hypothetical protein